MTDGDEVVADELEPGARPWENYLRPPLSDRARAAVSEAPEAVRAMVESTIQASRLNPDEGLTLQEWLEWVAALPWGKPA